MKKSLLSFLEMEGGNLFALACYYLEIQV